MPSSSLQSIPNTRSLQNHPHSPVLSVHYSTFTAHFSITVFISLENNCHTQVNIAQSQRHSIFLPQITNTPLPNTIHSLSLCPHSICLPTPTPAPQHNNNIFAPQLVHPIPQYTQIFSPSVNSTYIPLTTHSSQLTRSQHNPLLKNNLIFFLPATVPKTFLYLWVNTIEDHGTLQ
jgi:hypothetical protein